MGRCVGMVFSDEEVIAWRRQIATDPSISIADIARHRGVYEDTVGRAVRGKTYKHLDGVAVPIVRFNKKEWECQESRRLYTEEMRSINQIAAHLQVSKSSVFLWCKDLIRTKKPRTKPHVMKDTRLREERAAKKAQARAMSAENISYKTIRETLGISAATVSAWCRDVVAERDKNTPDAERKHQHRRTKRDKTVNGNTPLTTDIVVAIRRDIRAKQCRNLNHYARLYNCHISSLSSAINGKTFKQADALEPPVTEYYPPHNYRPSNRKRTTVNEEVLSEAITMVKDHPEDWTWLRIAEWLNDRLSTSYRSNNVRMLFKKRAPELQVANSVPVKVVKPKPVMSEYQKAAARRLDAEHRRRKRQEERARLKKLLEQEDRYERWVAAGCP